MFCWVIPQVVTFIKLYFIGLEIQIFGINTIEIFAINLNFLFTFIFSISAIMGMPLRLNHSILLPENHFHIKITDPVIISMPPIPKNRTGNSHMDLNDMILASSGFSGSYKISTLSPFL